MLKLHQILYLFRSLPIPIPATFFKTLQSYLKCFVWQKKWARCTHKKLIKHRSVGGTGYVDFRDYYYAAILAQLKTSHPTSIVCGKISTQISNHNQYNWLIRVPRPKVKDQNIPHTLIALVLAFRHFLQTALLGRNPCQMPIPIKTLQILILNISLHTWSSAGINQVSDLYSQGSILPFSTLQAKYALPNSDYYKYLQVSHCLLHLPFLFKCINNVAWNYLSNDNVREFSRPDCLDCTEETRNLCKWKNIGVY